MTTRFSAPLLTSMLLCLSTWTFAQMDNAKMGAILQEEATKVEGQAGAWQVSYGQRLLLVITDETNNRMRIFSPVIEEKDLQEGQIRKMLEANFHSALDAKYSLYEGYVVTVFTHPLKELTEEQFIDALRQVVILADTFGTTYNSTDMIFNPGQEEEQPEDTKDRVNKKPKKT